MPAEEGRAEGRWYAAVRCGVVLYTAVLCAPRPARLRVARGRPGSANMAPGQPGVGAAAKRGGGQKETIRGARAGTLGPPQEGGSWSRVPVEVRVVDAYLLGVWRWVQALALLPRAVVSHPWRCSRPGWMGPGAA